MIAIAIYGPALTAFLFFLSRFCHLLLGHFHCNTCSGLHHNHDSFTGSTSTNMMAHGMNMQQDINPFMAAIMMQQCGMPTLGRRNMGFGELLNTTSSSTSTNSV